MSINKNKCTLRVWTPLTSRTRERTPRAVLLPPSSSEIPDDDDDDDELENKVDKEEADGRRIEAREQLPADETLPLRPRRSMRVAETSAIIIVVLLLLLAAVVVVLLAKGTLLSIVCNDAEGRWWQETHSERPDIHLRAEAEVLGEGEAWGMHVDRRSFSRASIAALHAWDCSLTMHHSSLAFPAN